VAAVVLERFGIKIAETPVSGHAGHQDGLRVALAAADRLKNTGYSLDPASCRL
jgi:hypothetical protein